MPSGSAYQSLIIPPPRRSAPPAAQGGHGPPILIPHGPSTTYHPGAIQSHFAPSQAPSHGSYSSAGVPQAPAAVSSSGGQQQAQAPQSQASPISRLAQVMSAVGREPNVWATPGEQNATRQQVQNLWSQLKAKGFLSGTAPQPRVVFDNGLPGVPGVAMATGNTIHVPQLLTVQLQRGKGVARDVALSKLIHEIAHTAQNRAVWGSGSKTMVEGGAQAFMKIAAPKLFGGNFVTGSDGNYTNYTRTMALREPNDWITHGQFVQGAGAPTINMPTTPSFNTAMSKLGNYSEGAVRSAGNADPYQARLKELYKQSIGPQGPTQVVARQQRVIQPERIARNQLLKMRSKAINGF